MQIPEDRIFEGKDGTMEMMQQVALHLGLHISDLVGAGRLSTIHPAQHSASRRAMKMLGLIDPGECYASVYHVAGDDHHVVYDVFLIQSGNRIALTVYNPNKGEASSS